MSICQKSLSFKKVYSGVFRKFTQWDEFEKFLCPFEYFVCYLIYVLSTFFYSISIFYKFMQRLDLENVWHLVLPNFICLAFYNGELTMV